MRKTLVALMFVACLGVVVHASVHADVSLIQAGSSNFEIVRSDNAVKPLAYAAIELQRFVEQSTGVKLPIVSQPTAGRGHVFLGANPASAAAGVTPDDLKPEGFHIRTVGQDIHIVGRDTEGDPTMVKSWYPVECGTLYGVYEFMERYMGIMFLWDDELGTIVPGHTDVAIPAANITMSPDWAYRYLAYAPNNGTQHEFGRRLRLGNATHIVHDHSWYRIMPTDKYGKDHPEYFAMVNGKRKPTFDGDPGHGGMVCTSNPDVIRIFVEAAIQQFNDNPTDEMFSIAPNDGGGYCECPNCRALDGGLTVPGHPELPQLTDRILHFYNAVADGLAKVYPDKKVSGYLYGDYIYPPVREQVHPNVALEQATNSAMLHGLGWAEESGWEKQWGSLTPNFYKYDIYYYGLPAFQMIAPVTRHMIEKFTGEYAKGVKGGYFYIGQTYEQLGAAHWVMAKLMWNMHADATKLETQYYDTLYGAAGPDVLGYYHLLESRLDKMYLQGVDVDEPAARQLRSDGSDNRVLAAYWPILDQATALITQAQSRSLSDPETQRLQRLVDQHEYLVATTRGMIAAGRLEQQAQFNLEDVQMLKQAVEQREAAKPRMQAYAPTLMASLQSADKNECARVTPVAAFYQLSANAKPTIVQAARLTTPPQVDGLGADAVWQSVPINHFLDVKSAAQPQSGARAQLAFDDANLYLLVSGREPDTSRLLRAATSGADNVALFDDDSVELFLLPPGSQTYYHIAVGAGGATYDAACPVADPQAADTSWNSKMVSAVHIGDREWSVEMAIPFAAFGAPGAGEWKINVCRTRRGCIDPDEYTAIAPTFGGYHVPSRFVALSFADAAPPPAFDCGPMATMTPGDAEQRLRFSTADKGATIELAQDRAYEGAQCAHIHVPEGGLGQITLQANVKPETGYRIILPHFNSNVTINPAVRPQAPITRVSFFAADGSMVKDVERSWDGVNALDNPDQWRLSPHVFTTPAGAASITYSVFFEHPGDYWVDDARLEQW